MPTVSLMQQGGKAAEIVANSGQILLGVVFGGIALAMLVESMTPLRPEPKAPLMRWASNLTLAAMEYAVLFGMAPLLSFLLARATGLEHAGLLHYLGTGYLASFILTLLCMECFYYWLHRIFHSVPTLWRIHAVHHSDPEMDATTSHRHHPLEAAISTLMTVPFMLALGADPLILLAYNVLQNIVTVWNHGNYSLGQRIDRILRLFLATPDFHRLHHRAEKHYTDSNYSVILPLFDYLFRTATRCPAEQHKTMTLGLEYFREPKYSRLDQLLLMPFLPKFSAPAVQAR